MFRKTNSLRTWIFDRFLRQNLKARDPKTHKQYRLAVDDFAELLGRDPKLSDLTDEKLAELVQHLLQERGLAAITINERVGRIKTFWRWAADKRKLTGVEERPTLQRLPVPEKIPRAWREEELKRLFDACRTTRGFYGDVPAWRFMLTVHGWWWNTAERSGATFAMRPDHLDLDNRTASLPAEIRKGKLKPAVYVLWPDVVEMLRRILPPHTKRRERVFELDCDLSTFYNRYEKLLIRAGLPHDRSCKPHRMRVSHATWTYLAGNDPTKALGHSSPETTRRSYIDPTLAKQDETKLFRPW